MTSAQGEGLVLPPDASLYRKLSQSIRTVLGPGHYLNQEILDLDGSQVDGNSEAALVIRGLAQDLPLLPPPNSPQTLHRSVSQLSELVSQALAYRMKSRRSPLSKRAVADINPRIVVGEVCNTHHVINSREPEPRDWNEDDRELHDTYRAIPTRPKERQAVAVASFWHINGSLHAIESMSDPSERRSALTELVLSSRHVLKERSLVERRRINQAQVTSNKRLDKLTGAIGPMFTSDEVAERACIAMCSSSERLVRELALQAGITKTELETLMNCGDDEYRGRWHAVTPAIARYTISAGGIVLSKGPHQRDAAREDTYVMGESDAAHAAMLTTSLVTVDLMLRHSNPDRAVDLAGNYIWRLPELSTGVLIKELVA